MTTTTHPVSTRSTAPLLVPTAIGTFLAAMGFNALGVFADGTAGAEHSAGEFFVIGGVILVSCALVFGVLVPRRLGDPRAGRVALVLAVVAALTSVAVFWSGLGPAFAAGAVLLGLDARRTGARVGLGTAAVALGALSALGYVAIYVLDWLATNGIA